jgi:putative PIG3 family NAD(P)H quinone oxidoreductase
MTSMRAITISAPGGPEVLTVSEVPDPVPGADEVLIDIAAAGLNRADLMQRQGFYPPPPGAPEYPGLECSGRIASLGANVTGFSVGDEVCALLAGGGYAEKVAVHAGQVLPLPDGTTLVDAGGLPEVACTVHSNVVQLSGLAAGETLLIHGGGSGIGTFAIQLGKALGARVACTAGSQVKLDRCLELGADLAINYKDQDFVEAVRDFTGGRGADVILDIIGAKYLARNLAALAVNGRLAIIGLQGGAKGELDLGAMLGKRATVRATTLRARPAHEKAAIVAGVADVVWPLVSAGQIRPVIDTVLPLAEAAQAHRLMEADRHVGKILLRA